MRQALLLILVFSFSSLTGMAQPVAIIGSVKDSLTASPLANCNIYVKGLSHGTISNDSGAFRLVTTFKEHDTLVISFIGYKTKKIALSETTKSLNIFLSDENAYLQEVVVQSHTALEIIEMAMARIPENYFEDPHISTGFYRVSSKQGDAYVHLSEAVFDLYQSKRKRKPEQFKLEKLRAIKDKKASMGFYLGLSPQGIFEMDMVNHIRYSELLTKNGLEIHDFQFAPSHTVDGRNTYKITFDQKDEKFCGHKGYLIIDCETLAFIYLEVGLSPKGLKYHKYGSSEQRARLTNEGIELRMLQNDLKVWYKQMGNKYYLSHASNDASFQIKSRLEQYDFTMDTRVDYLVTNLDTLNVQRFRKSQALNRDRLIENQDSNFDEAFWDGYTILLPTESFLRIVREIDLKNKKP